MASSGLLRKTTGTLLTGWKRKSSALSAAGETSAHGDETAGYHIILGALLDCHEIPQLRDRLPPGNRPVAGNRRSARQARP
jgi:hypothetical protein